MQSELSRVTEERKSNDARVQELDKIIGQLLAVNESLISQLSGKRDSAGRRSSLSAITRTGVLKKKPARPIDDAPTAIHVSRPTASAKAKVTRKSVAKAAAIAVDDLFLENDAKDLQKLNKLYAARAKEILKSHKLKKSTQLDLLEFANKKTAPEKEKQKTRISSRTKKSDRKPKEESADTERYSHDANANKNVRIHIPSPSLASSSIDKHINEQFLQHMFGNEADSAKSVRDFPFMEDNSFIHDNKSKAYFTGSNVDHGIAKHATSQHANNGLKSPKDDLQSVISSLEDEFESLNNQYRMLLSSAQKPSEESSAEELVDVIHKLHRKGEQLRALKSPVKS